MHEHYWSWRLLFMGRTSPQGWTLADPDQPWYRLRRWLMSLPRDSQRRPIGTGRNRPLAEKRVRRERFERDREACVRDGPLAGLNQIKFHRLLRAEAVDQD